MASRLGCCLEARVSTTDQGRDGGSTRVCARTDGAGGSSSGVYTWAAGPDGAGSRNTVGALGDVADGIPLVTPNDDGDAEVEAVAESGRLAAHMCTPAAKDP